MKGYIINILFQMARYTSGKQGVIPRYDIASILVFNERIYEYGDKVKLQYSIPSNHTIRRKPYSVGSPQSSFAAPHTPEQFQATWMLPGKPHR